MNAQTYAFTQNLTTVTRKPTVYEKAEMIYREKMAKAGLDVTEKNLFWDTQEIKSLAATRW